jgi:hypothetical protein
MPDVDVDVEYEKAPSSTHTSAASSPASVARHTPDSG